MTDTPKPVPATPVTEVKTDAPDDLAARSHGNPAKVQDPGSELVDPDPAFEGGPEIVQKKALDIAYVFAGANVGGQSLYVCQGADGCSALVQEAHLNGHTAWHEAGSR